VTPALSAAAYGVLGVAMALSNGYHHRAGLALVLATLALVILALRAPWSDTTEEAGRAWLGRVLAAVVAVGLGGLLVRRPGIYLPAGTSLVGYRAGLLTAALVALTYAWQGRQAARLKFPVATGIYLLVGLWVIRSIPSPAIDVWHAQQRAVELLLHGDNPFTAFYPNIYGGTGGLFGSGALVDGQLYSFTYPPLVVLLGMPGWLVMGDVRLSLLCAVAGTAVFAVAAGRRLGLPPGHVAELAPIALLFHPRGYFLIEQAWVDPYMGLGAAALAWGLAGRRAWVTRGILALYLNTKQHACLWLPVLLASRRLRWRDGLWGVGLAGLLALPFLLWSPEGFWRGVFLIQLTSPFRPDSLSVLAAVSSGTGVTLPSAVGFAAAALAAALAMRWRRGRPGEEALGGAALYLAFFAFNKQAFLNYYWLVGAFLVLAAVGSSAGLRGGARPRG
jgi:hypothetical protein